MPIARAQQEVSTAMPTVQQQAYEHAYSGSIPGYGFPDRKIADGAVLREKTILSVGCGSANDLWYLSRDNHVIGLDYALSGLRAGAKCGVRGVAADLNFHPILPFRNGAFDLVVLKDILEHVLAPLDVLNEARRILTPGGAIVLSLPNHFYLPMRLRILFGQSLIFKSFYSDHRAIYREWDYMHIRFFTYRGVGSFLNEAGLRAEKWFWDFGSLAHYFNPDMWLEPQLWKKKNGLRLSRRAKIGLSVLRPLWTAFNIFFPRPLRAAIVSLAPGLLSAGFYVRARKSAPEDSQ